MVYRHDLKNLNPQQRAIVTKKDKEDEILRQQQNKKTRKKKCPYCNSKDVEYTGLSHGIGSGNIPESNNHQYKCNCCNKFFHFIGKDDLEP